MYKLSNSQSNRINYDQANSNYFDDQIALYIAAGGDLENIDRSTFDAWYDVEQESVDDQEEAEARSWSTFQDRLFSAKVSAVIAADLAAEAA